MDKRREIERWSIDKQTDGCPAHLSASFTATRGEQNGGGAASAGSGDSRPPHSSEPISVFSGSHAAVKPSFFLLTVRPHSWESWQNFKLAQISHSKHQKGLNLESTA